MNTTPHALEQRSSTVVSFRLPSRLAHAIEEASRRDGNPLSATIRRLISAGLRAEPRSNLGDEAA